MTDLAFHEGAIGLLRHFDDPSMVPPGLYRINLGEPNQLFHMAGWALSYVVSTRWAVKLLVAGAVAALPPAAARFARHVGASPIAALVVAPMALGWFFSWGLITNLIGLSALLAVLPVGDRLAERPSARLAAQALGANVLLYFAHMTAMFVFAGVTLGLCVLRQASLSDRAAWRALALRLSPFVSAIAITIAQLRWQRHFMSPTVFAMPRMWRPLKIKLREVAYIVLPATDAVVQYAMLALCVLAIAMFFWLRTAERRAAVESRAGRGEGAGRDPLVARVRAWLVAHRWEVVALTGFTAYFTFPVSLNGATLVHQRWFPPAFAVLAVVAAPRDLWTRRALAARLAAFVLPVGTLLSAGPSFADSDREYRSLEPLIALVAPGSAVAELDLGPVDPNRSFSLGPADGRILASRGGRLVYAFTDSPVSPMVLSRRYQWNESLVRVAFDNWRFVPSHDFKQFRYVLLRTQDPKLKWMASYVLSSEATLVQESHDWALFESKLPVVPPTSPEVPLDGPADATVRKRVHEFIDELRAAAAAEAKEASQVVVPPEKSGPPEPPGPP